MTDITQADREASADYFYQLSGIAKVGGFISPDSLEAAFAKHRIATQSAIADMLDEMAGSNAALDRYGCLREAATKVRGMS